MADVTWKEATPTWTAWLDGVAVCTLKPKDIGGCTASWLDTRLWPPPAHLPKAAPQASKFFPSLEEAKSAVEQQLAG
jgi:hypothetical protein